jgi:hypothetical protein
MKHEEIKTLLRKNATAIPLRPAVDFWADFKNKAAEVVDEAQNVFVPKRQTWLARFYPAIASAASIAACAAIYISLQIHHEPYRALNSFSLGSNFQNNGAVVITDSATDATILWVMTEEEES